MVKFAARNSEDEHEKLTLDAEAVLEALELRIAAFFCAPATWDFLPRNATTSRYGFRLRTSIEKLARAAIFGDSRRAGLV